MMDIFKLSNSPEVRAVAFHSLPISLSEHQLWFQEKLHDTCCLLIVAEINGIFAGQIRFDINTLHQSAVISISISADFRGKGFSISLIEKAVQLLKEKQPQLITIEAKIKTTNIASIRFFEKARFCYQQDSIYEGYPIVEYRYNLQ